MTSRPVRRPRGTADTPYPLPSPLVDALTDRPALLEVLLRTEDTPRNVHDGPTLLRLLRRSPARRLPALSRLLGSLDTYPEVAGDMDHLPKALHDLDARLAREHPHVGTRPGELLVGWDADREQAITVDTWHPDEREALRLAAEHRLPLAGNVGRESALAHLVDLADSLRPPVPVPDATRTRAMAHRERMTELAAVSPDPAAFPSLAKPPAAPPVVPRLPVDLPGHHETLTWSEFEPSCSAYLLDDDTRHDCCLDPSHVDDGVPHGCATCEASWPVRTYDSDLDLSDALAARDRRDHMADHAGDVHLVTDSGEYVPTTPAGGDTGGSPSRTYDGSGEAAGIPTYDTPAPDLAARMAERDPRTLPLGHRPATAAELADWCPACEYHHAPPACEDAPRRPGVGRRLRALLRRAGTRG